MKNSFITIINCLSKLISRYLPDAFIFSLLITIFVLLCGIFFKGYTYLEMIRFWGDGFWNLLQFSMQMCLVLVTGLALAKSNPVSKFLLSLSNIPKNQTQSVLLLTFISYSSCFINWGFGLVVSALFAVALFKKTFNKNFGLLVAMAYSGFIVWHGGFSGSIPLKLTDPSEKIANIVNTKSIPLSSTVFSLYNILLVFGVLIILLTLGFLFSKIRTTQTYNESYSPTKPNIKTDTKSVFENSTVFCFVICTFGLSYIFQSLYLDGKSFNLGLMTFTTFFIGLLFHKKISSYTTAFSDSISDSSNIILQFPFYAGIMGMINNSGMATDLSSFFISISDKDTFLMFTYWSAGVVNFFVPSGGGQWVIQGPIILSAAKELGISLPKAAMAIAWGDAWSNMLQPFWALPILSIAGLKLKDIMAYCVIIFLFVGIYSSLVFYLVS